MSTATRKFKNDNISVGAGLMSDHKGEKMKEKETEEKTKEIDNKKKTKKVIIVVVLFFILINFLIIFIILQANIKVNELMTKPLKNYERIDSEKFMKYEGLKKGTEVKVLIQNLQSHATICEDESEIIFEVIFKQDEENYNIIYKNGELEKYRKQLTKIYSIINTKFKYDINIYKGNYDNIHYICITKDGEEKTEKEVELQKQKEQQIQSQKEIEKQKRKEIVLKARKEIIKQIFFILIPLNIFIIVKCAKLVKGKQK